MMNRKEADIQMTTESKNGEKQRGKKRAASEQPIYSFELVIYYLPKFTFFSTTQKNNKKYLNNVAGA